jgi:hypothetical protein
LAFLVCQNTIWQASFEPPKIWFQELMRTKLAARALKLRFRPEHIKEGGNAVMSRSNEIAELKFEQKLNLKKIKLN